MPSPSHIPGCSKHPRPASFELLARDTENVVILTDADRRIEWVNASFTRLCGYTYNEVKGRNPAFLQGERTDQRTVDRIRKALNEGRRTREKILNYTKLGDEYWADLEIIPGCDEKGVANFLSITRHITGNLEVVDPSRRLRTMQNAINQASIDGLAILDQQGKIIDVNPAYCTMTGYGFKDLLGMNISEFETAENQSQIASHTRIALALGSEVFETQQRCKDGSDLEVQVSVQYDIEEKVFILFFKDISERKSALRKIARLTTLYRAINECNEAILYSTGRDELFEDICRIVVCHGNMKMAWVGKPDQVTGLIRPLAIYGDGKEYLENILISTDPNLPEGRGPAGIALREKRPVWCYDFANNPMTLPWHERASRFGWKSAASIPFSLVSTHDEVLTFYGDRELGFGDDVRELLVRMVKNISFVLDKFDH